MSKLKSLKSKQKTVLQLLFLLSLLFVCGCQCNGEIGTKANKTGSVGITTATLDTK